MAVGSVMTTGTVLSQPELSVTFRLYVPAGRPLIVDVDGVVSVKPVLHVNVNGPEPLAVAVISELLSPGHGGSVKLNVGATQQESVALNK